MDELFLVTALFQCPEFVEPERPEGDSRIGFPEWLSERLQPLTAAGFHFGESIQEDYGCGFWAQHGETPYWIALSYADSGIRNGPAPWVASVNYDPGLNFLKRIFHRPDPNVQQMLEAAVSEVLHAEPGIKMLTTEEWVKLGEEER